jgi:hypothetical protein
LELILQELNEVKGELKVVNGLLRSVLSNQATFVTRVDDIPNAILEKKNRDEAADEILLAVLPFHDMEVATDQLASHNFRKALYRMFDIRAPRSSRFVPWFFLELFTLEIIATYYWPAKKYVLTM